MSATATADGIVLSVALQGFPQYVLQAGQERDPPLQSWAEGKIMLAAHPTLANTYVFDTSMPVTFNFTYEDMVGGTFLDVNGATIYATYTIVAAGGGGGGGSLPGHVAVEVNFNVAIDADSKVILFGEAAPTVLNYIVAEQTLPVTALYDASGAKGLIEIWEPTGALGNIRCQLANNGGADGASLEGAYKEAASRLASGLQAVLEGEFDCSGATPFDEYTANVQYYKQDNFGRVALGAFAHYLFGHVDATAAITNDAAFVTNMLAQVAPAGDVETWDFTSSIASANLANRLVKEIIRKGKAGPDGGDITSTELIPSDVSGGAAPAGSLAEIVKQVIGQDSSRVQNADGSERTLDKHILLRFFAGDVIYVKINVLKPTVEVSGSGANPPANTLVVESETSYNLKITLA